MSIRFIIETISSKTDVNGNRYHYAAVTSVKTGNQLVIDNVGGDSNAPACVRELLDLDWDSIHYTNNTLAIREWNRRSRNFGSHGTFFEHQVTADILKGLES